MSILRECLPDSISFTKYQFNDACEVGLWWNNTISRIKFNYFQKKKLNIGKTWISCMVAMVTRIKYFETPTLSYIEVTPYFYFMILKIICSYTKRLWIIKFFRTEDQFNFIFISKFSYFQLISMFKKSKNDVSFETTLSLPQWWCYNVIVWCNSLG